MGTGGGCATNADYLDSQQQYFATAGGLLGVGGSASESIVGSTFYEFQAAYSPSTAAASVSPASPAELLLLPLNHMLTDPHQHAIARPPVAPNDKRGKRQQVKRACSIAFISFLTTCSQLQVKLQKVR